jgi:phospholipase/carboxylesterase
MDSEMKSFLWMIAVAGLVVTLWAAPAKSYKQTAQDALMAGDYKTGEKFLRKWVEADPGDAVSLYNLACCCARRQKDSDALHFLTLSTEAGWSDSAQANQDPDLASLHGKTAYGKLLDRMGHNAATRDGGYTIQYLAQERYGRYLIILPDEYDGTRQYPLVILLHGYGQSPREFAPNAALISSHDYIYAIPEGSYTALDSDGKGFSHLREFDDYREDFTTAPKAANWVIRVADDVMKRYPVEGDRVWLVGFSQGAALAHATAALYPERVAGYCADGGYMIKETLSEEALAREKATGIKVLVVHSKDDSVVSPLEGQYSAGLLKQSGIDATYTEVVGGHKFTAEVGAIVGDWLMKVTKN